MDLTEIRKHVITALFSDDVLMERFVLKGGSALELIHGIVSRGSIDVDLSIQDDIDDAEDTERRVFHVLKDRFDSVGMVVFDEKFSIIPEQTPDDIRPWWGGYQVEFKLIERQKWEEMKRDRERMRIQAHVIDSRQGRKFRVEISKFEFCGGKVKASLDEYAIYVYTPAMCAVEKLRAICQQMREYPHLINKRARARDFYDICAIITQLGIDLSLPENLELTRNVFAAKKVPLALIPRIPLYCEFHRADWDAVRDAVVGKVLEFDYYFDFVVSESWKLHPLWKK